MNVFDELEESTKREKKDTDWADLASKYKNFLIPVLLGLILLGFGLFIIKNNDNESSQIQVIDESTTQNTGEEIIAEISGAVEKPGVYKFKTGDRVEDLLIAAGGVNSNADRNWMDKFLNRASKLTDGQKVFIPKINEQSDVLSANKEGVYQNTSSTYSSTTEEKVNINTASLKMLEELPGIGPVFGQNIIEQRPYSNIEELRSRDVLRESTYEKIKDLITVY